MSKAAQGFSPEAYLKYVEGGNPLRTPLIDKIAIYGWKLAGSFVYVLNILIFIQSSIVNTYILSYFSNLMFYVKVIKYDTYYIYSQP